MTEDKIWADRLMSEHDYDRDKAVANIPKSLTSDLQFYIADKLRLSMNPSTEAKGAMSKRDELINRLEGRYAEREALSRQLKYRLNVEELFKTLAIDVPEGEPIRFDPVGVAGDIIAINYKGRRYALPERVTTEEWSLRFGVLKYKSDGG